MADDPVAQAPRGLDPEVALLPDVPVLRADEDLLGRAPLALRLCELAQLSAAVHSWL